MHCIDLHCVRVCPRSARPAPRDIDFSDVSLKTLPSLIVAFSAQVMCTRLADQQPPDHIIASSNGFRQSSRPHHHLPHQLPSNGKWTATQATTTLLAQHSLMCLNILSDRERCTGPSAIDSRRSSLSLSLFSISSCISLYAIHTRTSPRESIHSSARCANLHTSVTCDSIHPGEQYTLVGIKQD